MDIVYFLICIAMVVLLWGIALAVGVAKAIHRRTGQAGGIAAIIFLIDRLKK